MLQFYFMSVLLNVLTGLVLVYATDFLKENFQNKPYSSDGDDFMFDSAPAESSSSDDEKLFGASFLDDMTFRFVLGLLTTFLGLVKLFVSMNMAYAVLDDFFPAMAGILGGIIILLEFITVRRDDIELPDVLLNLCVSGRKFVGFFCIGAGILHFILPRVILL